MRSTTIYYTFIIGIFAVFYVASMSRVELTYSKTNQIDVAPFLLINVYGNCNSLLLCYLTIT